MRDTKEDMDFRFPSEIKELITTLGDENQWKILEFLISNDNKLSYTQLKEKLKVPEEKKGKLNYHLKELQKAGWIRNWLKAGTTKDERQKSFYSISEFGQKVIQGAMNAMAMESYTGNTWSQLQETIQVPSNTHRIILKDMMESTKTILRLNIPTVTLDPTATPQEIAGVLGTIAWGLSVQESEQDMQKNFQISSMPRRKIRMGLY